MRSRECADAQLDRLVRQYRNLPGPVKLFDFLTYIALTICQDLICSKRVPLLILKKEANCLSI